MVWSHSRLTTFEDCPYRFLINYILPEQQDPLFFSSCGGFVHGLLADLYSGNTKLDDLPLRYLTGFRTNVVHTAPSHSIYSKYFSQCLTAVRNPFMPNGDILFVEKDFTFEINGYPFVGVADLIFIDDEHGICIMDHKSRDLKPRSGKIKPTKSDQLLEKYFRQLYLYAAALYQTCGIFPDSLAFNCFRTGIQIIEKFDPVAFESAKNWATGLIQSIVAESNWIPHCDFFKCKYICGFHKSCAYYQLSGGDKS